MESMEMERRQALVHNLKVARQDAKANYRDGMAALAGAVNVVTTLVGGRAFGFAATSVCSITDEPPTLLVCLNQSASVFEPFQKASRLCVNTLGAGQKTVASVFGGKSSQEERFGTADWTSLTTGAPVLVGATVSFDCRIKSRTAVGTHDIIICEVESISRLADASGLVYFGRKYHALR
ncbi:FMN reductase (NADH) RutF [Burkholderia sp. THE68]|uniref:flavin reductase n=1 Tax=Burkholderia sp. THE68 TaxID=758782 RepID=UPI00131932F5|nr:flavin reductase [Burkholderia sp. THE68]BBU30354.1 FMN reductase (NADH) RutF [Burkholderia sp. THE68]